MKFAKAMALAAAVTLASGIGFTAAQAAGDMGSGKTATQHKMMKKKMSKAHKKMTTGSSVGTTTGPKSGIQGKAPGAATSPASQQANPAKNMK
jgi:hypothetical protein